MRRSHLLLLLALNFFWAGALSAYKVLAVHLSAGGIVTARFALAALMLAAGWRWLPGAPPRGRDLVKTGLMGLLVFCVGQRLQVLGNQLGTAGNSSILVGLEPLLASGMAALFLRERIGPRRWTGFALGLLGVGLLNGPWRPEFRWTGVGASLLFITSFLGDAAYSVIGKPMLGRAGPMRILALALLVGTVVNLALDGRATAIALVRMSWLPWLLLLGLAFICTVVGYGAWYLIIRESEVNVAALTVFSQPVFGLLLAAVWVGEPLHWGQLWGGVVIALGLVVGLSRQIRPRPSRPGAPVGNPTGQ